MSEIVRLPTGVWGLDEELDGGIPEGHVVVIRGEPGTLKTTLAMCIILINAVRNGKRVVYLTFEQSEASLRRGFQYMGMDLASAGDRLQFINLAEIRQRHGTDQNWYDLLLASLAEMKRDHQTDLVVLDSLTVLYMLTAQDQDREQLFHFLTGLQKIDLTIFLIAEMDPDTGTPGKQAADAYLADGVIELSVKQAAQDRGRFLRIVKMRLCDASLNDFALVMKNGEMNVVTGR